MKNNINKHQQGSMNINEVITSNNVTFNFLEVNTVCGRAEANPEVNDTKLWMLTCLKGYTSY